ncbi:CHAT domain-containing protein, partial [Ephemerocybe angulata]
ASSLASLGTVLSSLFDRNRNLSDLDKAIEAQRLAVKLTPASAHSQLFVRLCALGNSLGERFQMTDNRSDINWAISFQVEAVLIAEGHPMLPTALSNLGISFRNRFDRTGDLRDISNALFAQRRAVELVPESNPALPRILNNLGISLRSRFERTGNLADIADATSSLEKAIKLAPADSSELPMFLADLGNAFNCIFLLTGALSDIDQGISAQRKAIELTPDHHPALRGMLTNLGYSIRLRFDHTSDVSDIADSISAHRKALKVTPSDHPALAIVLNNLGQSLLARFEGAGDLSDISEAITGLQKVISLTPEDHPSLPIGLGNLGSAYLCRFSRTKSPKDVADAISSLQKAVEFTPHVHPTLPHLLTILGCSFTRLYESTGDRSAATQAISTQQQAVELTPESHKSLPAILNNLSIAFKHRFDHAGDPSDLAEAIKSLERAMKLLPDSHAHLPRYTKNLGSYLHLRFVSGRDVKDLDASIQLFRLGATCRAGTPWEILLVAVKWAQALRQNYPESAEILLAYDTVLGLVAQRAGLEHTVQSRYTQLEVVSGMATEAAAAAFALNRVDKALEWLEQGRCLVWNQLNSLRTPLDELRTHDGDLARRVEDLSGRLECAGSSRGLFHLDMSPSEKASLEGDAHAHLKLAREWDGLLDTVRAIPGFETFLKPAPCSTILHNLPASGHIVIINVDGRRCDAIALQAGFNEPLHIPLPEFTIHKANKYRNNLRVQLKSAGLRTSDETVYGALRGLWVEVVKPILDALGLSSVETSLGGILPRIWWCPTGPLSFLPIHAAGIYKESETETVLDYAVSSYTPTVTALTRIKDLQPINRNVSGLFLTSQPDAPDAISIPGTTKEVRSIYSGAEQSGVRVLKVEGSALSVDECLRHMEGFSSVHFACHAYQSAADPLQSRFILHNGSLDLATIVRSNLKNADLAFLSACQTSTGEEKLSDEAVHLAAGMLAAGYRRVVATMWSISDQHAQQLGSEFYEYLWSREEESCDGSFDGVLSAYALHHATQRLRLRLDNSDQSLLTWVPFVHFGY